MFPGTTTKTDVQPLPSIASAPGPKTTSTLSTTASTRKQTRAAATDAKYQRRPSRPHGVSISSPIPPETKGLCIHNSRRFRPENSLRPPPRPNQKHLVKNPQSASQLPSNIFHITPHLIFHIIILNRQITSSIYPAGAKGTHPSSKLASRRLTTRPDDVAAPS